MAFGTLTSILLIIGGIITALAGKFLLRLVVGVASGGLLAYLIVKLVMLIHGGLLAATILGVLGFIIGFFIGWFIIKLALSIISGITIGVVIASLFGFMDNIGLLLLTVIIAIGISYLLSEKIISLIVILAGTAMVYLGLLAFISPMIALLITIVLLVLVLAVKFKK
ncbi:hypothetical protein [Staphylothermus hellenicus]|uniref:DUF4203 domain-containing protein n=1 Tax=Staphylothermus hellenicus (strain DSM 12710 / JCM 10830 / BK20S6-10-b1 / P8) TaxID=591019 RepID=D7D8Y5_STAHD|nr:hypothetical protein [Staphylothermus hellenicus]ADI32231.1 conserved Hypothetical protein CBG09235 [Staphylothermus hellenicus DSM 12710]